MKEETKEALALELTRVKISNLADKDSIDASKMLAIFNDSIREINEAISANRKPMNINPSILDMAIMNR
jgi:hypothetical protein